LGSRADGIENPWIIGLQTLVQDIEAADNNAEHVVEVMSDAAGKLADHIHLLGLTQDALGARADALRFRAPVLLPLPCVR
jgi:hypothetical protein